MYFRSCLAHWRALELYGQGNSITTCLKGVFRTLSCAIPKAICPRDRMTFISVREQPRCKDRRGLSATRLGQRQQRNHARRLHPALPGHSSPLPRWHLMLYAATAVGRAGLIARLYQAHVSPAMGLRVACGFPMAGSSRHTRALPEKSTSRPCRSMVLHKTGPRLEAHLL